MTDGPQCSSWDNLLHFSCKVAHSALHAVLVCSTCFTRYNTSLISFVAEALTNSLLYDSDWRKEMHLLVWEMLMLNHFHLAYSHEEVWDRNPEVCVCAEPGLCQRPDTSKTKNRLLRVISRICTRPRATRALSHGTTQVLMELWLAAVSTAEVKRFQANVTSITDLFFQFACVFLSKPLHQSLGDVNTPTLASQQTSSLHFTIFPATWQVSGSSTGPCMDVLLGSMCFCLASHPASVPTAVGAPTNACPVLGTAL